MESYKSLVFICRNDKNKSFVDKISSSAACNTKFGDYIKSKLGNNFWKIKDKYDSKFDLEKPINYNSTLFPLYFDVFKFREESDQYLLRHEQARYSISLFSEMKSF